MVDDDTHQQVPARPPPTPDQQAMREVAARIADTLDERVPAPRAQIARAVRVLGIERAQAFCEQALAVEQAGGMLLPDGSRRRTPGGVFFKLVRDGVSTRERGAIFPQARPGQQPRQPGSPQAAPSQTPPVPPMTDIPHLSGEVRTVKITLIGRPGPIAVKTGYIITSMRSDRVPSLPKGLPAPPTQPTVYTVYIAQKQWTKVAEALRNAEDVLIAEGTPVYDRELEGIAVYVTNTTTKLLQQAQRAAQQGT
jgi:hypothetical protein